MERRPGCACVQAEIAAAEDFDPLRIRPYVTLDAPEPGTYEAPEAPPVPPPVRTPAPVAAPPVAQPAGDAAETMPLLLPGVGNGVDQDEAYDGGDAYGGDGYRGYDEPEPRPATRRRGALVALAAAVAVAVIGTAAVATGLLDDDGGTDDRAAVPTVTTSASENVAVSEEPSTTPSTSASASASASASPSTSPSGSASASSSPSAVRTTRATTAPAAPPPPSATRTTSSPTPTPTPDTPGPTLRYGDSGAEVEELQRRLTHVRAYDGPIDGSYSRQVRRAVERFQSWQYIQEDEKGVYGPETRRALEAQTPD
ncbi:peptidoglycan-binding protein [Streptomyces sp. NPDC003035]|uniref:peptidoglycan-binding domain-containing protein n=1 Tax=Streptomyces sp. NPDC003035 TaxID=3364676 RepID=UPI003687A592